MDNEGVREADGFKNVPNGHSLIVNCQLSIVNCKTQAFWKWSSYKERKGNALAPEAEEGRSKQRYAAGSRKQTLYPRISEWRNPLKQTLSIIYWIK